jgi:indolepyruvate ferredoxin oxidoreductase alpha subunit
MGRAAALVTMKHVGLNVAADPLFTAAYTGTSGPLLIVSADDPGMASSQNEQDNRRLALAAAVPMLEPADSQESYDFTLLGLELSAQWDLPFILRTTTRVCHSKSVLCRRKRERRGEEDNPIFAGAPHTSGQPSYSAKIGTVPAPGFTRDIGRRVMVPGYARPAHRRLRQKLA